MINASEFTVTQRAELEALMRTRIEQLKSEIADEAPRAGHAEAINLTTDAHDIGDEAEADLEGALGIAELQRDLEELRALEAALERLRTPGYGVCVDCGVTISFARLKAQPAATRCTRCQARYERSHAGSHTPRL